MSHALSARLVPWLAVFIAAAVGGWWTGSQLIEWQATPGKLSRSVLIPRATSARPGKRVKPGSVGDEWVCRVKSAAPDDFPALFHEMTDIFPADDDYFEAAASFYFGAWLAKDFDAAIAFAANQKNPNLLRLTVRVMVEAWPEKALPLITDPADGRLTDEAKESGLHEMVWSHPDIYLNLDPDGKTDRWKYAVEALAENDPEAAAEIWSKQQARTENDEDVNDGKEKDAGDSPAFWIGRAWAYGDAPAARRWAESLPEQNDRELAVQAVLSVLAHKDPRAALKELAGCHLGKLRWSPFSNTPSEDIFYGDARQEIAARLAVLDFAEAMAASDELARHVPADEDAPPVEGATTREPDEEILRQFRGWIIDTRAQVLPTEPAALLSELDAMDRIVAPLDKNEKWWPQRQELMLNQCLDRMPAEDWLTALRLRMAAGVADGDRMLARLLYFTAHSHPDTVLGLLPDLPTNMRGYLTGVLMEALPPEYVERRSALMRQTPPLEWHGASGRPEYAPMYASLPAGDGGFRDVRARFARDWASDNPIGAAAWAVARQWASYDEAAAAAWVATLAPGAARDQAANVLADVLADSEPNTAWKWAASISDGWERAQALLDLGGKWNDAQPEFRSAEAEACAAEGITIEKETDPNARDGTPAGDTEIPP
jgi:hypothetical protein